MLTFAEYIIVVILIYLVVLAIIACNLDILDFIIRKNRRVNDMDKEK